MNKKMKTTIGMILFVVFLVAAYTIYTNLSEDNKPNNQIQLPEITPTPAITSEPENQAETGDSTEFENSIEPENSTELENSTEPENSSELENSTETENSIDLDPVVYKAPDFTVFDSQGNEIHLSDFLGKSVVLNFWASWCPPCKSEMPHFNEVYKSLAEDDDVVFIMIDLTDGIRETQADGEKYVEEEGFEFPVYFDLEQSASTAYEITSIPTTLFIDSDGNISTGYQGGIDKETLISGIDLITD